MDKTKKGYQSTDEYIGTFPAPVKKKLLEMRKIIRGAAPRAEEKIAYQIPTFTLNGNLVHFGGFKEHIGFFPGSSGIAAFKKELAKYKGAKGSVQFPLGDPLPKELIKRIVKFRVAENEKEK